MDDNNKKKKNKKKKNKSSNKPVEHVSVDEREVNPGVQSLSADTGRDSDSQVSVNTDADCDGHLSNGTAIKLPKTEETFWLDREALLEARINQLLKEKDDHHHIEVTEKKKIEQLNDEKNASIEREARLKENVVQLNEEKDTLILRQSNLEQTIQQLEREINLHQQKTNSDEESIASLTIQIARLQAQVIELEHSRDSLIEEKQVLAGHINSLELRIKVLEGSDGSQSSSINKKTIAEDVDLGDYRVDTDATIENTIPESPVLTEKVSNEVGVSPVGSIHGATTDSSHSISVSVHHPPVRGHDIQRPAQVVNTAPEVSKLVPFSSSTQSLEDVLLEDEDIKHFNHNSRLKSSKSSEIDEVGDENAVPVSSKDQSKLEATQNNETSNVPLSDAPLIGAPFRFISFVARYVSGADLVANTGKKPG